MCGVLGIYRRSTNVASDIIAGLSRLQHRGQESAGIALIRSGEMVSHKDLGLVSYVARQGNWLSLAGNIGIGHVRYSTKGSTTLENASPILVPSPIGQLALAYNGNLVNANALRAKLSRNGFNFETTTDTEIIAQCLVFHMHQEYGVVDAIRAMMEDLLGAYSLTVLTSQGLYAVRDPWGIRPLCLGEMEDGFCISSETCALERLEARFIKEIENGEIIRLDEGGIYSWFGPQKRQAMCVFEFIYMARPDSCIYGKAAGSCRFHFGLNLAEEERGVFDKSRAVVVPMLNTGLYAASGFSWGVGLPFAPADVKDRYDPLRTFIRPSQDERISGVDAFTIIKEMIAGKHVIPVDDSIVRGNTKRGMVRKFRNAGARKVHLRIASPPYEYSCCLGVDTADESELIAARQKSKSYPAMVRAIRKELGADSLHYLSLEGLYEGIGIPRQMFCDGCLTGEYPIDIPAEAILTKASLE